MEQDELRALLHQVANLLAVIQVQAETALAVGTREAAQAALVQIQRSGAQTDEWLRAARKRAK
jgi:hypothetical protein